MERAWVRRLRAALARGARIGDVTDIISPLSMVLFSVTAYLLVVVLFHPAWHEFVVLLLVDSAALPLAALADRRLFTRWNPRYQPLFPALDLDAAYFREHKGEALRTLIAFAGQRARYLFAANLLKVQPAWLVILLYFEHDSYPLQALKLVAFQGMFFSLFYAVSYVEIHDFVSRKVRELHARHDYSQAFAGLDARAHSADFRRQMAVGVAAALGTILFMLWVASYAGTGTPAVLAAEVTAAAALTFVLLLRLLKAHYDYFAGGLEAIHRRFVGFDARQADLVLPLHSASPLGLFEQAFNRLMGRLREYEEELTRRVTREADESRYHTLGEISGLVAHDLATPLHVIGFCAGELEEGGADEGCVHQLELNADRALELVGSLRGFMGREDERSASRFSDVHAYVRKLLKTRYRDQLRSVRFALEPDLNRLELEVPRLDLVHILHNLYKNSVEAFANAGTRAPCIRVEIAQQVPGWCTLAVADNGNGLDTGEFERLTGYRLASPEAFRGLGLRLIRRLVERHGGDFRLDAGVAEGTRFLLTLPCPVQAVDAEPRATATEAVS